MSTPEYAAYLQDLVQKAGIADPERKVFGANKHQYQLNPVISLEDVQAYQKKYHVVLPSEYVFFITQVGNGGAGPDYGIYPLKPEEQRDENIGAPFISSKLTKTKWCEKLLPYEDEHCPDDLYEQIEMEIMQGIHFIGTKGCTFDNIAIAEGAEENRVFYVDWDWNHDNMPQDTGMNFLEWYEKFFLEIIAGNSVRAYGSQSLKTQEELILAFESCTDAERRRKLFHSFTRFPKLAPQTMDWIQQLSEQEFAEGKLILLLKYDTKVGIQLFSRLLTEQPKIAIQSSVHVPKEQLKRFYRPFLYLLYTIENGSEKKTHEGDLFSLHECLLYRLMECPQLCVHDILLFLEKNALTQDDIKAALYVLRKVPDLEDAVETLVHFMKNGSYSVVHTALETACHFSCSALVPVYLEMWEKYRDDSYMCAQLKIAFKTNGIRVPK